MRRLKEKERFGLRERGLNRMDNGMKMNEKNRVWTNALENEAMELGRERKWLKENRHWEKETI